MDAKIKEKWLAWLRDPEHKQGQSKLIDLEEIDPHYCCLGGLCEVYRAEVGGEWLDDTFHDMIGDQNDADLPIGVSEWAGIDGIGSFPERYLPNSEGDEVAAACLIHLNDDLRWSFEQIADFIEENF